MVENLVKVDTDMVHLDMVDIDEAIMSAIGVVNLHFVVTVEAHRSQIGW